MVAFGRGSPLNESRIVLDTGSKGLVYFTGGGRQGGVTFDRFINPSPDIGVALYLGMATTVSREVLCCPIEMVPSECPCLYIYICMYYSFPVCNMQAD